jgi:septum formation protein
MPFAMAEVETAESLDGPLASDPPALAIALAAEKALAARETGLAEGALTLCFDTIVVLDGEVLGKPRDLADAWRMLRALSGRTHEVVTGVAFLAAEQDAPSTFAVVTQVVMRGLSDADIEEWMRLGTFMGCAGAYNIEAQVAAVADTECYQNVAGMPLCHLYAALRDDPALAEQLPAEPTCPLDPCDAALGRTCALGPRVVAQLLR